MSGSFIGGIENNTSSRTRRAPPHLQKGVGSLSSEASPKGKLLMGIEKVLYGFPVNTKLNSDLVSRVCGHLNIHSFRNGVCNELCRNSNSGRQFLFRGRYFTACKFKHDIFNKFKHQILHKSKEITNSKTIYRDFVPISHFDFQYFLDKYSI